MKKTTRCPWCGGWINPSWSRGDGDYRHCEEPRSHDMIYQRKIGGKIAPEPNLTLPVKQ